MAARLRDHYLNNVVPALTKEFGYTNIMGVPKVDKVTINIGLGEATGNAKLMDAAVNELGAIAGARNRSSRKPRNPSRRSSFAAKAWRSARWSRCAATGCTSFSTVSC